MNAEELASISVHYKSDGWQDAAAEAMYSQGALLVLGAFSPEECTEAREAFGRDLKRALQASHNTTFKKSKNVDGTIPVQCETARMQLLQTADGDVPAAWPEATPLGPPGKGMATTLGLAQGEFAWKLRLSEQLRSIFSVLHACPAEEMCVGSDQPFFTANSKGADGAEQGRAENVFWMHADQNKFAGVSGVLPSFQGVAYVNASDTEHNSTTVLQLCSHADGTYDTLMNDPIMKSGKGHFGRVQAMSGTEQREELLQRAHASARRVPAPAGSVLVWDSRVLHQGWQGGQRLAMPVVWEPLERRDTKALARKMAAAIAGVPTTHWASLGLWHPMVRLGKQPIPQPEYIPHQPQATVLPVGLPPSWALDVGVGGSSSAAVSAGAASASAGSAQASSALFKTQEAAEYIATVACNAAKKQSPIHLARLKAALSALHSGASPEAVVKAGKSVSCKTTEATDQEGHTLANASRAVVELLSPLLRQEVAEAL